MRPDNRKEREIRDFINPRAPEAMRAEHRTRLRELRRLQEESAWEFRQTGKEEGTGIKPPYGRKWNRDYNPSPYQSSSKPRDPLMYLHTGVGAIYGIMECVEFMWMLAGWNITDKNKEVRRKRKW